MHLLLKSYRHRTILLVAVCALAGTRLWAQTTSNLLTNPGAELGTGTDPGIVTGWTAGGASNPGRDNGTFDDIAQHSGSYDFYGNAGASGTLLQRVDLFSAGITAAQVNTGTGAVTFNFYERSLDDRGTVGPFGTGDTAGVNLMFLNAAGTQIGTTTSGQFYSPGQWTLETTTAAIPSGTRYIDYQMSFFRNVGIDADAYIDDASLTATVVPEPATWAGGLLVLGTMAAALRRVGGRDWKILVRKIKGSSVQLIQSVG